MQGLVIFAVALTALVGCALLEPPKPPEVNYTSELLACTVQAKATDAGRAGSKACECEVDKKWGLPCSQ